MMERASAQEVWRETRHLTREVQGLYIGAAIAVIVSTLITLSYPALVKYAIDHGISKGELHPVNMTSCRRCRSGSSSRSGPACSSRG
jgi:ABC-type multidrug transport system fused ATPase/permease subunit